MSVNWLRVMVFITLLTWASIGSDTAMSARTPAFSIFWRQCLQSPMRPGFQMNSASSLRYFNSSAPRYKAKGVARTVDSAWQAASPYGNKNPRALAKLQTKVIKAGQVLLFQAPSHRPYVLTAYGLSAFCFAYSIYNSNAVLVDPLIPLPMWQKTLFGGICIMMSVGGTLFIARTGSLVRNIRVKSMPRRIFQSVRQLFTNEDFIIVQLAGHKTHFRLDSNGYISDDLLHFGRMVNVKMPFRD